MGWSTAGFYSAGLTRPNNCVSLNPPGDLKLDPKHLHASLHGVMRCSKRLMLKGTLSSIRVFAPTYIGVGKSRTLEGGRGSRVLFKILSFLSTP